MKVAMPSTVFRGGIYCLVGSDKSWFKKGIDTNSGKNKILKTKADEKNHFQATLHIYFVFEATKSNARNVGQSQTSSLLSATAYSL